MLENIDHRQVSGWRDAVRELELTSAEGRAGILDLCRDDAGLTIEKRMGWFCGKGTATKGQNEQARRNFPRPPHRPHFSCFARQQLASGKLSRKG
jgi:hypothetical protein